MNNLVYDARCRALWREEKAALDDAEPLLEQANAQAYGDFTEALLRIRCIDRVKLFFIYAFGFGVGITCGLLFEDVVLAMMACFVWIAIYCDYGVKGLCLSRYRENARATRAAVERLRTTIETGEPIRQGMTR